MEGFLKANRIVEASLSKLTQVSKNNELSLRKALLVSKTLAKAQDTAVCVQNSLTSHDHPISRSSSKLMANMRSTVSSFEEDTVVSPFELHNRSNGKLRHQPVSPIVLSTNQSSSELKEKDDDVMEFISHSVISDLLSEDDMECPPVEKRTASPWTSSIELNSATGHWSPLVTEVRETSPPLSPIKRQHNIAFPLVEDNRLSSINFEESKRFKFSSFDYTDSLPGFCDHLSPKNLCSAPLITYMFGKGFGVPSNPMELDWPRLQSQDDTTTDLCSMSPSKLLPVLAY